MKFNIDIKSDSVIFIGNIYLLFNINANFFVIYTTILDSGSVYVTNSFFFNLISQKYFILCVVLYFDCLIFGDILKIIKLNKYLLSETDF